MSHPFPDELGPETERPAAKGKAGTPVLLARPGNSAVMKIVPIVPGKNGDYDIDINTLKLVERRPRVAFVVELYYISI